MSDLDDILAERRRQIEVKGYDAAHDDADGEDLLRADGIPMGWPWEPAAWKPGERRRNLVKAGALCVADRERRERNGLPPEPSLHKFDLVLQEMGRLAQPAG